MRAVAMNKRNLLPAISFMACQIPFVCDNNIKLQHNKYE